MRLNLTLATLALLAAAAPAQQTTLQIRNGHPVVPGAARPVVTAFEERTRPLRARFAAIRPDLPVAAQIAERVAVEQGLRAALPDMSKLKLSDADKGAAFAGMWFYIAPVDAANTTFLKLVLPTDGWFRRSRDGDETTHGAWLLVQHSPDRDFMRQVVERMKPLVEAGEVRGSDYALLYDRTEGHAGRAQYYGSQFSCANGRYVPDTIRDPETVDERRRALGMSKMAEDAARLNQRGC